MKKFGKRLQELREKVGLTQVQLAEATGLPLGSIRNYEQGHRDPLWQAAFKLAAALGVGTEAFRDCIDSPSPADTSKTPPAKGKRPSAEPDADAAEGKAAAKTKKRKEK